MLSGDNNIVVRPRRRRIRGKQPKPEPEYEHSSNSRDSELESTYINSNNNTNTYTPRVTYTDNLFRDSELETPQLYECIIQVGDGVTTNGNNSNFSADSPLYPIPHNEGHTEFFPHAGVTVGFAGCHRGIHRESPWDPPGVTVGFAGCQRGIHPDLHPPASEVPEAPSEPPKISMFDTSDYCVSFKHTKHSNIHTNIHSNNNIVKCDTSAAPAPITAASNNVGIRGRDPEPGGNSQHARFPHIFNNSRNYVFNKF